MGDMADYLLEQADADIHGVLEQPNKGERMQAVCPNCGCHPFQHWNCGHSHKCHVCGYVFTTKESCT